MYPSRSLLILCLLATCILSLSPCSPFIEKIAQLEEVGDETGEYFQQLMDLSVCYQLEENNVDLAEAVLTKVLKINKNFAFPYVNLGNLALNAGNPETAILLYKEYFRGVGSPFTDLIPQFDSSAQRAGSPCSSQHHIHVSDCIVALNNLAAAQTTVKSYSDALKSLHMAIELSTEDTNLDHVYINLAEIYEFEGRVDDAANAFSRSFEYRYLKHAGENSDGSIDPSPLMRRAILLPAIPQSVDAVKKNRILFERRVNQMLHLAKFGGKEGFVDDASLFGNATRVNIGAVPPLKGSVANHVLGLQTPQFFLHYNGGFDRPLQELVCNMHIALGKDHLLGVARHLVKNKVDDDDEKNAKKEKKKKGKFKIAFVSSMFHQGEPHGLLLIDVIKSVPSVHFEKTLVSVGSRAPDPEIVAAVDQTVGVGFNFFLAQKVLNDLELDVLVFAEMQNEVSEAAAMKRTARRTIRLTHSFTHKYSRRWFTCWAFKDTHQCKFL